MSRHFLTIIYLTTCIFSLTFFGCTSSAAPSTHVLMLVGGSHHDYETLPPKLAARLIQRGELHVDVCKDLSVLNEQNLERYQVLLFNTCRQEPIDEPTRQAILQFVSNGRGLVAMHCSLWSFQDWPEWAQLVGGFAPGHDKYGTFPVTVLDPAHPAMLSVGNAFEITDEPYYIDKRDPNANWLIRTSKSLKAPDGTHRSGPEPQVWTKSFGAGRVYAITFGHDEQSQSDERFITLLHNAIRWASGAFTEVHHNVLSVAEKETGFRLLFNGRDLTGWEGHPDYWSVEHGELVGRAANLPHNTFLVTREEFGDFLLRYSVKLRNHNSGVQFRGRRLPNHVVHGYQADVAERLYGNLHEEGGPRNIIVDGWKDKGEHYATLDGWNEMTVEAIGPHITITINGLTTADYIETQPELEPSKGVIALQLHDGPPMEVRYRDIRIKSYDK